MSPERHTDFLAGAPNGVVIVVEDDAYLLHKPDLLLIVALEVIGRRLSTVRRGQVRIDLREEVDDILGGDGLRCCAHSGGAGSSRAGKRERIKATAPAEAV